MQSNNKILNDWKIYIKFNNKKLKIINKIKKHHYKINHTKNYQIADGIMENNKIKEQKQFFVTKIPKLSLLQKIFADG